MAYAVLPIPARTEVNQSFSFTPIILEKRKGEVTQRTSRDLRKLPKIQEFSYSTYISNLQEVEQFLLDRVEAIPFILPQDGRTYISKGYTVTYQRLEKGTINISLVHIPN